MTKTRIVLVDDNEDALEILQYFIGRLPQFDIVDRCRDAGELIDAVMRLNPDLVLLDINLPRVNGIQAIRSCLKIKPELLFIFVTGYDEYAVEAFELSAVDYLVKPIEKERLYAALGKIGRFKPPAALQPSQPTRLLIKDNNGIYFVVTQEIIMIEKIGKKCHILTTNKTYIVNENIRDLLMQLPSDIFFLSHRSYIINLTKLTHISISEQTFLAYFTHTDKHAHISKLKIDELQSKLKSVRV